MNSPLLFCSHRIILTFLLLPRAQVKRTRCHLHPARSTIPHSEHPISFSIPHLRRTPPPPLIITTFSAAADGAEGIRASQIVSIFVFLVPPTRRCMECSWPARRPFLLLPCSALVLSFHLGLFGAFWALPATQPPAFPLSDGVVLVASRYWLNWELNRSGRCILHKEGDVRCSLSRVWSVFGFSDRKCAEMLERSSDSMFLDAECSGLAGGRRRDMVLPLSSPQFRFTYPHIHILCPHALPRYQTRCLTSAPLCVLHRRLHRYLRRLRHSIHTSIRPSQSHTFFVLYIFPPTTLGDAFPACGLDVSMATDGMLHQTCGAAASLPQRAATVHTPLPFVF
ncbi:hypothetical protein B0H13DRAFT_220633 [Mycena leptocephala]|nr:hypothetical protein B0H13DRAFT_220633 [Mycena leptocephala]